MRYNMMHDRFARDAEYGVVLLPRMIELVCAANFSAITPAVTRLSSALAATN